MKIKNFFKKSHPFGGTKGKEQLTFNQQDNYIDIASNLDMANGCIIIGDIIVDVAADVAIDVTVDVVGDVVADSAADATADVVADTTTDVVADSTADSVADATGDAAADIAADAASDPAMSAANKAELKVLALTLGGAVVSYIVNAVTQAINNALGAGGGPANTTAADYWSALYDQMMPLYPCNNNEFTACPSGMRDSQILMVGTFEADLGLQFPDDMTAAATFETNYAQSLAELKNTLTDMAATAGIPSMIQYMVTYTNPGASGATLVIATADTLVTVASYCYND